MPALTVTAIRIYPVKSTAPVSLETAKVYPRGLEHDRRWMLTRPDGVCITARDYPRLTQVQTRIGETALHLSHPEASGVEIALQPQSDTATGVTIWGQRCNAVPGEDEASQWFSKLLGAPCQLVAMTAPCARQVDPEFGRPGDEVSFADGYPLLLTTTESLADLNTRTPQIMSMDRFRPNVVVSGAPAWAEDHWQKLRIGDVNFVGAKDCDRCVFTTIDPASGDKHPDQEPLRTLSKYRRRNAKVYFGRLLIPQSPGVIRCGDTLAASP